MGNAFQVYFACLKSLDLREATEHTLRPALHNLLAAQVEGTLVQVVPEPKRDESGRGAPDVKFKIGACILGYLENKKPETALDPVVRSDQIKKYAQLSDNLLLTNYLEWLWLREGIVVQRATLAAISDLGNPKARLNPDKAENVRQLIAGFLSVPPKGISTAKDLAESLATRCHTLRAFMDDELVRQEKEDQRGRLFGLFSVFKRDVFHELSLAGFADAFAQMLGYGLFLARLNSEGQGPVTLVTAKKYIPVNFELIRELVNFLDELDAPEYGRIKWIVEEILHLMNTLDLGAIQDDLTFTARQGRLFSPSEEERLLFARDPYIYFYEGFLKAYDSHLRKSRGVYYTPPPVVDFIVRAVNDVLKETFGIKEGLADRKRVTVLDFATGTGTFLLEVIQQILGSVSEGVRDQVIREHVLKNLYGFEYLIAPYTIAHLKLSQFLRERGYVLGPKERFQIYLTNTLEPIEPQQNWLLPALSKEIANAQIIKDKSILVITGNPPYSGHSLNKGAWISQLIETYKKVDGQSLGEKNPKWLQDDYVKFIRFAQWKMAQVEEGVVGIITNHSFLDNPTFRGMRQSLMETFHQIYILDLHGNNRKKEESPDGSPDENIFDIEQGVCISILIRRPGLSRGVFHAELWGKRQAKYKTCLESSLASVSWEKVYPTSPFYLLTPQDTARRARYEKGTKITEIFPVNVLGFQTHRDHFAVDFQKDDIERKVRDFRDADIPDETFRETFALQDKGGWHLSESRHLLRKNKDFKKHILECCYRPFDKRWCYFGPELMDRPRRDILSHVVGRSNLCLGVGKCGNAVPERPWELVTVSDVPMDANLYRRGGVNVFPLYLHAPTSPAVPESKKALLPPSDSFKGEKRCENIAPAIRAFLDKKYGHAYSPEAILGYVYAVLHSPTYRTTYAAFLKIDFPRIPFVDDRKVFEKVSSLGQSLMDAHLMRVIPDEGPTVTISKGSDLVESPRYQTSENKLFINADQFFSNVPEDVWAFHVGGYQVLDKYLKSRKGRTLTLDEKEHMAALVKVLRFTLVCQDELAPLNLL